MPSFNTPEPISVTVEIGVGEIQIEATDRQDTVVDVRPSDSAKKSDVAAAQQTRVEYANGQLLIKAPSKGWRQYTFRGGGESIDVHISLPAGSNLRSDAGVGLLRCTGRLGECHLKTGMGDIQLQEVGRLEAKSGAGEITVDKVTDHAEITNGSGTIHVGSIDGNAVVKNSNGDTWIGPVGGDLRVNSANGKIAIGQTHATVAAKTANGDIRLGPVAGGSVVAETAMGKVEVGVSDGVAAWLDVNTHFGTVRNELDAAGPPQPGEATVEVRARTAFGDIIIGRSSPVTNDQR